MASTRPPRDNLFRSYQPGPEFRDTAGTPVLAGHFSVFNTWTEINSAFEGRFLERIAPGAFTKTFAENRDGMKVLFNHGRDTSLGLQSLGTIETLREDQKGAAYEVALNRGIPELLMDGLRKQQYGASFRFSVMRDERVDRPKVSSYNPEALPERTVKEAQVFEFGPVTFPQYGAATAGVRSLTDEFLFDQLISDPEKLRALTSFLTNRAPSDAATSRTSERAERPRFRSREEYLTWITSI